MLRTLQGILVIASWSLSMNQPRLPVGLALGTPSWALGFQLDFQVGPWIPIGFPSLARPAGGSKLGNPIGIQLPNLEIQWESNLQTWKSNWIPIGFEPGTWISFGFEPGTWTGTLDFAWI